jgi:AbrB family looped-hinge helix DNA binding protein
MAIIETARISRGFRVTIPKEVRDIMKLKEGDEIVFFTVKNMAGRVCFRRIKRE